MAPTIKSIKSKKAQKAADDARTVYVAVAEAQRAIQRAQALLPSLRASGYPNLNLGAVDLLLTADLKDADSWAGFLAQEASK